MNTLEPTIIEIVPGCKYVLSVNREMTDEDVKRIAQELSTWLNDRDHPILVLTSDVKLVKIE